jgi:hypothetical protein
MLSHIVIFWTDPTNPSAPDSLIEGAKKYLRDIPGVSHFHAGKMSPSHRPVVEQSYQVGLRIGFENKAAEDAYQNHPAHLEFVEKSFKPNCIKVVVYDFE